MNILIEEIKEKFQNKEIIPVIGAGVSRTVAGLPNWSGLINNAIKYLQDHNLIEQQETDSIKNLIDKNQLINAAGELEQIFKFPSNNFAQWINHELHTPTIHNTTLIDNIESLSPPFLITTNYDTLISNGTIRYTKELSWNQPERLRRCITENEKFVFHLHGIYTDPNHLVFGTKGYKSIMNSSAYRDILNLVWLSKSLIFIGCSRDGVLDEDLIITIKRFRENFISTSHKHYILLRKEEADIDSIRNFLREFNIQIVVYGENYDDLAPFILELNTSKEYVDTFVKVKNEIKKFLKNPDQSNNQSLTKLKNIYKEIEGSEISDLFQFTTKFIEETKGNNNTFNFTNTSIKIGEQSIKENNENFNHGKSVKNIGKFKTVNFFIYNGSILNIDGEIDLIVSSENNELSLGNSNGNSISGRLRKMAMKKNENNVILEDPIDKFINKWKETHSTPLKLGEVIFNNNPNLKKYGVSAIAHLISIEKNEDDKKIFYENSVKEGLAKVFTYCENQKYSKIFIPILGIGKTNPSEDDVIKTIRPAFQLLSRQDISLEIYFGVYKDSHEALSSKVFANELNNWNV
ncbi:SIR2 family protein [Sphingobacterium siyangense]|uniref:SIR2 family protein n=1 Tax=Sphingobacterium siyangense TaxID=459529 RepID=UPI0020107902|nr:SIR2 family protein [Sphingobacterium siyangense]UQA77568.1 SIR2 family protein [Sphingobacterium siyangense]